MWSCRTAYPHRDGDSDSDGEGPLSLAWVCSHADAPHTPAPYTS
jgi:hypothetical protein